MDFYQKKFYQLEVIKKDHHLWIYLNSPENHNALSSEMIESLVLVLQHADANKDIRAIVLSGRGKSFCAGGDIKAMKNQSGMFEGDANELRLKYQSGIQKIPKIIESLETPIVAMVQGAAVGAGMDLICMCDFRLCSQNARFSGSFSKLGLVPGDGGTYFLSRLVGYAKALEIYLLGEFFDAHKALSLGMITAFYDDEELLSKTEELCHKLSSNAPIALALTKKALKMAQREGLDQQLDRLSTYQGIAQRTKDHNEAVNAFLEKRIPLFKSE